ncbi:MAG: methyltransferase domain-containing protein [Thermoleophilia bacterium]|nr:methyltransferase domain-containing protein [Thermoleophilia bacterium]
MDETPISAGKSSFDLVNWQRVLPELGLDDGIVLVDIAGGAGNYALAIAEASAGKGMIHSFDLWRQGVDELSRRSAAAGFKNIRAEVADVSKRIPLPEHSVDACLIATAFHDLVEAGAGEGALAEVSRVLKAGGRLVVIEFKKMEGPPGPPISIRLSPEELDRKILPLGFRKGKTIEAGTHLYLSTYFKTAGPPGTG